MRKGTTMLLNLRLLKWAHYYGIQVAWNLLNGFPGETREDYEEQVRLIPMILHLPPPVGGGPIWLERFSPYFTDPSFPVRDVAPWPAYRFVYPEDQIDLRKIAYFFNYGMGDTVPQESLEGLGTSIKDWQDRWVAKRPPVLVYQRAPDWIQFIDRREANAPRAHSFQGLEAAVYELCGDTDHTPASVAEMLRAQQGVEVDAGTVEGALDRFCELGLMVQEQGRYLGLALPVNGNW